MKKQMKFKIYRHECVECGHSTWRDYIVERAICYECLSTKPPKVTEDELIKQIEIRDTYTPEEYKQAKRIAQEIIEGKPLEEIEGLDLDDAEPPMFRFKKMLVFSASALAKKSRCLSGLSQRLHYHRGVNPLRDESAKDNYY